MSKKFNAADIVSVMSGAIVTPYDHSRDIDENMEGVYRVLSYMTGTTVTGRTVIAAHKECKPALEAQFPQWKNLGWERVKPDDAADENEVLRSTPVNETGVTFRDHVKQLKQMTHDWEEQKGAQVEVLSLHECSATPSRPAAVRISSGPGA
jgi:hypothetical protein